MILVDTSVWVDHFRRRNVQLSRLLEDGEVCTHPMVLGELACGNLPRRTQTLALLATLPRVPQAGNDVVLQAIELRRLWGQGVGWVDAHLLCAALISRCELWTLDLKLSRLGEQELR